MLFLMLSSSEGKYPVDAHLIALRKLEVEGCVGWSFCMASGVHFATKARTEFMR